jgi:hypothetical protein
VSDFAVSDVIDLLRQQAEGQADALTHAATRIRDIGGAFTADEVADMLTGFAAATNTSAYKHFGDRP